MVSKVCVIEVPEVPAVPGRLENKKFPFPQSSRNEDTAEFPLQVILFPFTCIKPQLGDVPHPPPGINTTVGSLSVTAVPDVTPVAATVAVLVYAAVVFATLQV